MGNKGGTTSSSSSWLTAVKKAFWSPNKDSDKKCSTRKEDEEDKKGEKRRRRWLFRRQSNNNGTDVIPSREVFVSVSAPAQLLPADQRHAIAVAAATAAAAEAAVATAKAAVEIMRLTQPTTNAASGGLKQQHSAAALIQTAFRGYLARRALIALKGIVKLQALIRGQIVRRQANMAMKCMQALFRVQTRVRDQRAARLSHDVGRKSMFAESTNLWESKHLKDIRARNSRSREGSFVSDEWGEFLRPRTTLQELEAILKARNEASFAQERSLAFAFQQQNQIIMDSDRGPPYESDVCELREEEEDDQVSTTRFLNRWMMPPKPWREDDDDDGGAGRASSDFRREPVKTLEIDSLKKEKPTSNGGRRSRAQSPIHSSSEHRPVTPSFASRPRNPQVRSASPRCLKEDRSHSAANTPSLRMQRPPRYSTSGSGYRGNGDGIFLPNYMAATESAKARVRSQSAPRQRPCTPDRERGGAPSVKKRLSYPIPEPYCCVSYGLGRDLRSPSFKSVQAGYLGMMEENGCYAESVVGGEISPCSTTDLRRWLR